MLLKTRQNVDLTFSMLTEYRGHATRRTRPESFQASCVSA
jgi:hypothetical protein